MSDIFDTIKTADVFDEISKPKDIFDEISTTTKTEPSISLTAYPDVISAANTMDPRYFEGILSMLSSMGASTVGGLNALLKLIEDKGKDIDMATLNEALTEGVSMSPTQRDDRFESAGKGLQDVGEALTYQPRTEQGQVSAEMLAAPFEKWHELSQKWGDVGDTQWTPVLQSLIEASPMALPLLKKAGKKIPYRLKTAKTPTEMAASPESAFLRDEFSEAFLGKKKNTGTVESAKAEPEYVQNPAIKLGDGTVVEGDYAKGGHIEIVSRIDENPKLKTLFDEGKYKEGGVTDAGTFVERKSGVDFSDIKGREVGEIKELIVKHSQRVPTNKKTPEQVKATVETRHGVGTFNKKTDTNILYSGIPPSEFAKLGNVWTKNVGSPVWDKLISVKLPKFLEKVPGGKALNRAFLYDYRGNLPKTGDYISSMEMKTRNQAIGREYGIDLGNRLQAFPEEAQLKIGEYIRGEHIEDISGVGRLKKYDLTPEELSVATETVDTFLNLGKQAVDLGMLSEEVFFKNAGKYMPRLYTKHEYQSLLNQFKLAKPNRLDLTRFKTRKDIPKEIRQEMGEILTPGYPVAKGITQLTHDIELAKYFNGIAKNPEWAIPKEAYRPKSPWQEPAQIPDGFVSVGKNPKLGALNDAYVHPEIFADLQESIRIIETPERVWRKSLGYWKFGKVILSPKTHVRNLMSNSVLAHLGGMPMYEQPVYLTKASKAMINKGEYWQMGKQEGLLRSTFTNAELRTLFDQVETNMKGVAGGSIVDNLGKVGQGWDKTKGGMQKAAKLYEAEEQWFKMAKMIHNIERKGMTPKAAAADAEKWLFNYEKVTKFQDKYRRKWYGAPFATFTFKALPRVAEAAIKTPWRFAVPAGIIYGLERAAMEVVGDTPDQFEAKKEMRPEWQKGKFLGVIPNFARWPFVDEYGREHNLNLTYILPWGDIAEGGDFMGIPGSIRPMSMPIVNEAFQQIANTDTFWKSNIVKDEDVAGLEGAEGKKSGEIWNPTTEAGRVAIGKRLGHAAKTFLPTPVVDIEKAISSLKGEPDSRGRFRNPKIVAADIIAGIKIYPVDYADEIQRYISKNNPESGEISSKIRSEIKTLSRKKQALEKANKSTKYFDERIQKKIEQLLGLAKEVKEKGAVYRRTK